MQLVCPSCLSVNRVARERLAKVDTTIGASIAARFSIRSIPTLVLLLRGKELARFSGAVPAHRLLDWLDQSLAAQPKREAS